MSRIFLSIMVEKGIPDKAGRKHNGKTLYGVLREKCTRQHEKGRDSNKSLDKSTCSGTLNSVHRNVLFYKRWPEDNMIISGFEKDKSSRKSREVIVGRQPRE